MRKPPAIWHIASGHASACPWSALRSGLPERSVFSGRRLLGAEASKGTGTPIPLPLVARPSALVLPGGPSLSGRQALEPLLGEMGVEGEHLLDPPLSHQLEAHAVNEAQLTAPEGDER